jgi:ribonuclease-3
MADASDPHRNRLLVAEQHLGHRFSDPARLLQACTHASRCGAQASAKQKREQANERLEFLGDALLGAALCLMLYRRFPDSDEGELSRWKAKLASREVLAEAIARTALLDLCLVGHQLGTGGPTSWPMSVKANLCESLLAGVFLDGGWNPLLTAVERLLGPLLEDPLHGVEDPRMQLQTWCLQHHRTLPVYQAARSGGSDHEPEFTASVQVGERTAQGTGPSRKRAEAAAAARLLLDLAQPQGQAQPQSQR